MFFKGYKGLYMKHKNQQKFPIIGISANLLTIESGNFLGLERTVVVHDYIEAIRLSGGIPIVLPIVEGEKIIEKQMALIDGLLLSGGYDVSPLFYNEEPKRDLEAIRPDRDLYEIQLIEIAKRQQKPIFGICRGLQILNVALGGTLYQDVGLFSTSVLQHIQKAKPDEAVHNVQLVPQTKLQQIFGEDVILTNSFHHQAIKDLAPNLKANAHSLDGVVEGIEGVEEDHFVLAVQWHPELMISKHPIMFKLFHAFIEAAQRTMG